MLTVFAVYSVRAVVEITMSNMTEAQYYESSSPVMQKDSTIIIACHILLFLCLLAIVLCKMGQNVLKITIILINRNNFNKKMG